MMLSTGEAAAAVGMTKQGILAAIHKGRLSATRNDSGQFTIDPAELFRVYDPIPTNGKLEPTNGKLAPALDGNEATATPEEPCESCRQQLALLREMLAMREEMASVQAETIADLRTRLEASTAQAAQLTAVIAQWQPAKAKTGWWARLLGGN